MEMPLRTPAKLPLHSPARRRIMGLCCARTAEMDYSRIRKRKMLYAYRVSWRNEIRSWYARGDMRIPFLFFLLVVINIVPALYKVSSSSEIYFHENDFRISLKFNSAHEVS